MIRSRFIQMKNYVLGLLLFAFVSCTHGTDKTAGAAADSTDHAAVAGTAGVELAKPVEQDIYDGYIKLKNALVAGESGAAGNAAKELVVSLKAREGCENTAVIAGRIAAARDIAAQRKDFTALSSDLIALFKHAELKKGEIFVQHCPMANNGDGGDWLASEKSIRNPYYGDEMLECGAVVEEIKTAKGL